MRVAVAGAGIFGVTAAIELRRRGHAVRLIDPGPLPHPLAASTDISKVVRLEYGPDEAYTALAEESLQGWRRWNRELGGELFHETGVLFLRRTPLVEVCDEVAQQTFFGPHGEAECAAEGQIRLELLMPHRTGHRAPPGHGSATVASVATSSLA